MDQTKKLGYKISQNVVDVQNGGKPNIGELRRSFDEALSMKLFQVSKNVLGQFHEHLSDTEKTYMVTKLLQNLDPNEIEEFFRKVKDHRLVKFTEDMYNIAIGKLKESKNISGIISILSEIRETEPSVPSSVILKVMDALSTEPKSTPSGMMEELVQEIRQSNYSSFNTDKIAWARVITSMSHDNEKKDLIFGLWDLIKKREPRPDELISCAVTQAAYQLNENKKAVEIWNSIDTTQKPSLNNMYSKLLGYTLCTNMRKFDAFVKVLERRGMKLNDQSWNTIVECCLSHPDGALKASRVLDMMDKTVKTKPTIEQVVRAAQEAAKRKGGEYILERLFNKHELNKEQFTSVLQAAISFHRYQTASFIVNEMAERDMPLPGRLVNSILGFFVFQKKIEESLTLLQLMIETQTPVSHSKFLSIFRFVSEKKGRNTLEIAYSMFVEMRNRGIAIPTEDWGWILGALFTSGFAEEGFTVFKAMRMDSVPLDERIYRMMLRFSVQNAAISLGQTLLNEMTDLGLKVPDEEIRELNRLGYGVLRVPETQPKSSPETT